MIREAVLITATGTMVGGSAALVLTQGVEQFLFR